MAAADATLGGGESLQERREVIREQRETTGWWNPLG
jgi:hypothetical protein